MNSNTCDNNTATILAHFIEHYANIDEELARIIQLAQQLSLSKGLKNFGKKGRDTAHK